MSGPSSEVFEKRAWREATSEYRTFYVLWSRKDGILYGLNDKDEATCVVGIEHAARFATQSSAYELRTLHPRALGEFDIVVCRVDSRTETEYEVIT